MTIDAGRKSCSPQAGRFSPWNAGTLTALAIALFVALSAGQESRPAGAQPGAQAIRPVYKYQQLEVLSNEAARALSDAEAKGWEAFQVVPVANPNPGAGGPMRVLVLFRRRA